jgi:hypothetical protein
MDDAAIAPERRIEAMLDATTTEADGQTARAAPDDAAWEGEP